MGLEHYKTLIIVITAIAALLIASPALQKIIVAPQTDRLTEMGLLGPNHDASYPSNVTAGQNIRLYLDVGNHLGACSYYVVEIKFRGEGESAPDSFTHTNSLLPSLGSLTVFAANNQTTEIPLDVSFQYTTNADTSTLNMQSVTVNGAALNVDSTKLAYDSAKGGFLGNLFFELWIYDQNTNELQYHERYVGLWLKML